MSRVSNRAPGSVCFVGAGPGDPGLLTVRAVEELAGADVVIIDETARHQLLVHAREGVEVLDGTLDETGSPRSRAQRAKMLVAAAGSGRRVVRLMDGDPAVFNGLSEEAGACVQAGIPFEVVPGVSAVSAVPAHAGIPLTSPSARAVGVLTPSDTARGWAKRLDPSSTLVLLGAIGRLAEVTEELLAAGWDPQVPVAVIRAGTTTEQTTVVGQLDDVAGQVRASGLTAPATVVVGEVVRLRQTLSWYETKPLFGWRVLVPRTKEQAGAMSMALTHHGAVPAEVPTIAVEAPRTPQQMEKAVRGLVTGRYEWIAFTSCNAIRAVRERFDEYGLDARTFSGVRVAAVGEATAADLVAWGIKPDLVPAGEQSAAGLLAEWPPYDPGCDPINRVFLPRADIATETLVAGLVGLGWEVDDVTAYRTVRAAPPPIEVREAIKSGGFDAVLFTSSSTVRNLVGIAGKPHASTVVACIGPATAKTAQEHGLRVDVLADQPSVARLVECLADFAQTRRVAAIQAGEPVTRPSERRSSTRRKAR
ncbi:MAG: bifunctional uroporphyrinogen-III C-methyltransferase/uroporphyrinogen-III synthase [Actinomycetes bacterium]